MRVKYYNQNGQELKITMEPAYKFRNNPENKKPEDFVMIQQAEFTEVVTDPYGVRSEITRYSNPVKEIYFRWVWDNAWYAVITMIVEKNAIVLDKRPPHWKFFEKFKERRISFV